MIYISYIISGFIFEISIRVIRDRKESYLHILLTAGIMLLVYFGSRLILTSIDSYFKWIAAGILTVIFSLILTLSADWFFYREQLKTLLNKGLLLFKGKHV